ncbi:MAG: family 43 glycosylhydrolase [Clostridia bacterium]|nr:family 43 glycosylhydrolase [Clostridia bacterium]
MLHIKFISSALAAALVIGAFPALSLAAEDGGAAVYSVTFDDGGEYQLEGGAALSDGKDGKAVRLDGEKKQYVKLADNITESLTGDYTISVDVYPENDANFARVFDLGTDTSNFAYFTAMGGGVPKFRYKGDDLFSNGVFLKQNEWNNVTITRHSDGEARLFINGNVAATSRSFVQPLSALGKTDANYLGKSHFENDAYFSGMIDNFEIYDYAIPEGEIFMQNGGEVQVTAGYKLNGNEIYLGFPQSKSDDSFSAYAEIKNYKNLSVTAKLINIVYDQNDTVQSVIQSGTNTIAAGEMSIISNDLEFSYFTRRVASYLYTDIGGFEKISEITRYGYIPINPSPEDTMETTIGVHDPSIFKDPKSSTYYVYSTGMIDIFKSEDLIRWEKTANTLKDLPQCVYDTYKHDKKEEYSNIWAPDMFYDENDTETPYHLTCSYSDEFGKNNSSIILFKASSPEGPWENGQIIFTSRRDDEELSKVNAIDSNICVDHETGQKYMVYGSFWHGIHIKELNDDGTVKDPDTVGTRIMSRKDGIGGPEGAYVVYNEGTGYYYLFASFDSLSDTYNIRVARSKSITGPYVDQNGIDVDRFDAEDNTAVGYKLMGSWQFPNGNTYYGPGHCSVFYDGYNGWYLVHHQRTVKGGLATLNVRYMRWTKDGWPKVMPERYSANDNLLIGAERLSGNWDIIRIGENTNAMLTSERLTLNSDKTAVYGDKTGYWIEHNGVLDITLDNEIISVSRGYAWDYDNNRPTMQFTGVNQDGIEVWGKKAIDTIIYK